MEARQLRLIRGEADETPSTRRSRRGNPPQPRAHTPRLPLHAEWSLDDDTRARGLAGVRHAKRVLEAVRPPDEHFPAAS